MAAPTADERTPLLDGIVSGLHAHDGTLADEIALRLAGRSAFRAMIRARLLSDRRNSPLGTRALIVLRGSGIQWAPDDGVKR